MDKPRHNRDDFTRPPETALDRQLARQAKQACAKVSDADLHNLAAAQLPKMVREAQMCCNCDEFCRCDSSGETSRCGDWESRNNG